MVQYQYIFEFVFIMVLFNVISCDEVEWGSDIIFFIMYGGCDSLFIQEILFVLFVEMVFDILICVGDFIIIDILVIDSEGVY